MFNANTRNGVEMSTSSTSWPRVVTYVYVEERIANVHNGSDARRGSPAPFSTQHTDTVSPVATVAINPSQSSVEDVQLTVHIQVVVTQEIKHMSISRIWPAPCAIHLLKILTNEVVKVVEVVDEVVLLNKVVKVDHIIHGWLH